MRRVPRWSPALLLVLLSGCFAYRPASLDAVSPGEQARVSVSAGTAARLGVPSDGQQGTLEGTVTEGSGGRLSLRVPGDAWPAGTGSPPLERDVTLEAADVLSVEVRRFDRGRTAALAGVAGAVGTYWVVRLFNDAGGSAGNGENGGSDHWRAPIGISLSIPF